MTASRRSLISALALTIGTVAGALAGCAGSQPFVREGSAETVEVGYSGDVASTLPLARRHCAQFERVPQLVEPGFDIAIYDCVRR